MRAYAAILCAVATIATAISPVGAHAYGEPAPRIENALFTVNPNNVLSGAITFDTTNGVATPQPAYAVVIVHGPDGSWVVPTEATNSSPASQRTAHTVNIVGLRAEEHYTFTLRATSVFTDAILTGLDVTLEHDTGPLPSYFPPIETLASDPKRMEPGVTLVISFSSKYRLEDNIQLGLLFALDAAGRVVWYDAAPWRNAAGDTVRMPNGNLVSIGGATVAGGQLKEFDYMGEVVREWQAQGPLGAAPPDGVIGIATDSIHHAVSRVDLEGGATNLVVLSSELQQGLTGYSKFGTGNPSTPFADAQNVVGDVIVEFDPDTGAVVKEFSNFDQIDPLRVDPTRAPGDKADFAGGFYNVYYGQFYPAIVTRDWTHGNGLVYDPATDNYVVSLRHQDIVYAFSRETGDLQWVIGSDDPETALDDLWPFVSLMNGSLPYHTHDPTVLPNGDVMVYDNGVVRPEPFLSRGAQFRVTPGMDGPEAQQVWDFVDPDYNSGQGAVSTIISSSRLMPGGKTVLICHGAFSPGLPAGAFAAQWHGKITEVAYEVPQGETQEKVFEVNVGKDFGAQVLNYRAFRYPSLYFNVDPAEMCGTVARSTGQLGLQMELQNIVDDLSGGSVGALAGCLGALATP